MTESARTWKTGNDGDGITESARARGTGNNGDDMTKPARTRETTVAITPSGRGAIHRARDGYCIPTANSMPRRIPL